MKTVYITIVALALFVTTGCSVLISTPPVARIQIHGMDNQLDEYIVILDPAPSSNMIDIPLTDRYVINLDFQWLLGPSAEFETADADGRPDQYFSATPWMMCTYKF